ncbi:MAG: hypothetical protein RL145_997 [Pseudomonadota bacterium]|jgi:hypothetical protein
MSKTFSPSEAAFSVFELMKRQPQFVMRYAMLSAGVMAIYMFITASSGAGDAIQRYAALTQSEKLPTMEQMQTILGPVMPSLFFSFLVSSILSALMTGMALRKALHDREEGFWGLQVGPIEGRFLLATLALMVIIFVATTVLVMVTTLLATIHGALGSLAILAMIGVMIWMSVRLSQFGVMGVVNGTLGLKESYEQTNGKFWRYLGAYLLWLVITVILGTIVQGLAAIGASALGTKIGSGLPSNAQDFLSVGWAFYILLYGMVSGVLNLGFICIGAYAWHQSRGDLPPPKSDL